MRLSEWRKNAPVRDALGPKVMAVITPVLGVLDVGDDPQAWVQWGDDPNSRYTILVPTPAGLVSLAVRTSSGGPAPRATAKLIRWSRLQMGELVVETEGPHRMVSFQVDGAVLRGADAAADAIGRFALVLIAAVEGRPWPSFDPGRKGRAGARVATKPTGGKAAGSAGASSRTASSRTSASPRRGTPETPVETGRPRRPGRLLALPAPAKASTARSSGAGRRTPG